ncbi:patatin-like phospholipase family protein [Hymenobacter coccineus]|uniref:patatin-like phospholipase family protein n=1 Tax=Hymenobacter coccineus TaxID=1908235 RepID=UPI0034DACFAD
MEQLTANSQQLTANPKAADLSLALSGGGARGIAHLGVLAALDELELPVGRLAGVSSGGHCGGVLRGRLCTARDFAAAAGHQRGPAHAPGL